MPTPFDAYIASIAADLKGGHATEHTYRPALERFMEAARPGVKASNDPKHIACGAPDFIIEKGKVPLGYVETKDVGVDLDKVEKSEQMKRYLKALNNLILTDYLEFRWYLNGEKHHTLRVASVGKNGKLVLEDKAALNLEQLFKDFYAAEAPTVTSPKELAGRLAGIAHFIRDQIIAAFTSGDPHTQKGLETRLTAFRELLLPAMSPEEFADLYAQAMTYGLFAAKLSTPLNEKFSLLSAYLYLSNNGFLRKLFLDVSEELDEIEIIRPYLHDIVSLLNRADFGSILTTFGRHTRTEDPVVHFYETFLAAYDPKLRESRGVYYTPEPVVQFIVRSVDELLKTRFGKPWGLADSSVKVLDPATGTGTFLYFVVQQIHEEVVNTRRQAGQWPQVSKELLERVFGFELLMAPYVVAHLKLGLELKELGAPLEGKSERLRVFLTNTLEEGISRAEHLAGLGSYIAQESSDAAQVKKAEDIMVVLGNPPYSNFGMMNKGEWIQNLLEDYKKNLDEKKINLDDDYIKFIRFGQWRIEQTGQGILALITNHSFIDGITHRRMRESLRETFNEIFILDLHGSTQKEETPPAGIVDNNVFDIKQGVSISLFVKEPGNTNLANVYHTELWGTREGKYDFLSNNNVSSVHWTKLEEIERNSCLGKFYFYTPKAFDNIDEYCDNWSIEKIFGIYQNGIKTDRDSLFFDYDEKMLSNRIKTFFSDEGLMDPFREKFNIGNSSSYDLLGRRKKSRFSQENIHPCLYRPFDIQWLYYSPGITSRPAWNVMRHMREGNISLLSCRQQAETGFHHVFCSELLTECCAVSLKTKEITSVFPLYLYTTPEETAGTLFAQAETTRRANLSPAFIAALSEKLGIPYVEGGDPLRPAATSPKFAANLGEGGWGSSASDLGEGERGSLPACFTPEDVFFYAYAVFHSPTYRTRYAEFLKIDFPRLPLTGDRELFFALAERGKKLVELHLLKSPLLNEFITSYPAAGDNRVEKVAFAPDAKRAGVGRVWINAHQYFGGVPAEVWNFKIGGYQVCDKWLKDRKGRVLSGEDINHYQRVIVALQGTIRLMAEIDAVIPAWPME